MYGGKKMCIDRDALAIEDNPAYGMSGPHMRCGEIRHEYENIQTSSAAPQEAVYERVF